MNVRAPHLVRLALEETTLFGSQDEVQVRPVRFRRLTVVGRALAASWHRLTRSRPVDR